MIPRQETKLHCIINLVKPMFTIEKKVTNEINIKNSRFITILTKIKEKSQVEVILNEIKKNYPKATHYCYAYILDDEKKSSDDKEPSGTAGIPILNVLEKNNYHYILAVVVRYFGGIKLGTGGLVRAYQKSVQEALKMQKKVALIKGKRIFISFPYKEEKQVNYLLSNSQIINKKYDEEIKYEILMSLEELEKVKHYSYQTLESILIEKKDKH